MFRVMLTRWLATTVVAILSLLEASNTMLIENSQLPLLVSPFRFFLL